MKLHDINVLKLLDSQLIINNDLIIGQELFGYGAAINTYSFHVNRNGYFYYRTKSSENFNQPVVIQNYPIEIFKILHIKIKRIIARYTNAVPELSSLEKLFDITQFNTPIIDKVKITEGLSVLSSDKDQNYSLVIKYNRECFRAILKAKYNIQPVKVTYLNKTYSLTPEINIGLVILYYDNNGLIGLRYEYLPVINSSSYPFEFENKNSPEMYKLKYYLIQNIGLVPIIYNNEIPIKICLNGDSITLIDNWLNQVNFNNIILDINKWKKSKDKIDENIFSIDERRIAIKINKNEKMENIYNVTIQSETALIFNGIGSNYRHSDMDQNKYYNIYDKEYKLCLDYFDDSQTYHINKIINNETHNTVVKYNMKLIRNKDENIFTAIDWLMASPNTRSIVTQQFDEIDIPEFTEWRHMLILGLCNKEDINELCKSRAIFIYFVYLFKLYQKNIPKGTEITCIINSKYLNPLKRDSLYQYFLNSNIKNSNEISIFEMTEIFESLVPNILYLKSIILDSFNSIEEEYVKTSKSGNKSWKTGATGPTYIYPNKDKTKFHAIQLRKGFSLYDPLQSYKIIQSKNNINNQVYIPSSNRDLDSTETLVHETGHHLAEDHHHDHPNYKYTDVGLSSNENTKLYPTEENTLTILRDLYNMANAFILK